MNTCSEYYGKSESCDTSSYRITFFFQDKITQNKCYQSPENLLNFHYLPIQINYSGSSSYVGHRSRRRTTTFNKEAFLQAK